MPAGVAGAPQPPSLGQLLASEGNSQLGAHGSAAEVPPTVDAHQEILGRAGLLSRLLCALSS
jgi:hypothetical protein